MKKKERWHGAHHYSNKVHLFFVAFLALSALTIYGSYVGMVKVEDESAAPQPTLAPSTSPKPTPSEAIYCTLDVKLCPDGKYVPRTGPNCEFRCAPGVSNYPTLAPTATPTPTTSVKKGCPDPRCSKNKPCEHPDVYNC